MIVITYCHYSNGAFMIMTRGAADAKWNQGYILSQHDGGFL